MKKEGTQIQKFEAEVDAKKYISLYRDAERIGKLCRQCGNYGKRRCCPPFDFDPIDIIGKYRRARIIGFKVTPPEKGFLISPDIDKCLSELETELGGFACGITGDENRPSLEAFGFDVEKTSKELLGVEIKWGKDGCLPPYLMLVCGIFF